MAEKIKFIHTADIHLGQNLSYNKPENKKLKQILQQAAKKALQNLVDLAIKEEVDFILIAGDLYDQAARSIKASRFFLKQAKYLEQKNIKIYIISGNHDPAGVEKEVFSLPANVFYFSSTEVEIKNYYKNSKLKARILGQSYQQKFEARKMYQNYNVPDQSVFNIALLHTALNKNNKRYVPTNKTELLTKKNINYWALGHLHQYQKIKKENPAIFFPGTLQAHNIREEGVKGAILVEVDQNLKIKEQFISLAPVIFQKLEIELEKEKKIENLSDLQILLAEKTESLSKNLKIKNQNNKYQIKAVILRILIKGRSKINNYLENNRAEIAATLKDYLKNRCLEKKPYLYPNSLYLKTAPALDSLAAELENNPIYQHLDDLINRIKTDPDLEAELLAEWGEIWNGSSDSENRSNFKFYPDQKIIREILREAKNNIISELLEGAD